LFFFTPPLTPDLYILSLHDALPIYLAIIVTVVLAFVFSLLFSKRLTTGYRKLSKAIQELQDHKWRTRVPVKELSDEMKPLGESFNRLAESLSKEEILRKQFTA